MAYQSNETGRFEIYVLSFPAGGVAIPISTAGGVYARCSRDGNELYYVAPDATLSLAEFATAQVVGSNIALNPKIGMAVTFRVTFARKQRSTDKFG